MALPAAHAVARMTARTHSTVQNVERHTSARPPRFERTPPRERRRSYAPGSAERRTFRPGTTAGKVSPLNIQKKIRSATRRARTISVSLEIASILLFFCFIQFLFGLLQFGGYSAEYVGEGWLWGLGAAVVPGQTLFVVGYIASSVIGVGVLGAAALIYLFTGILWWRGAGWIWFGFFLCLSIVPFLNTFPWLAAWMVTVVYTQK